MQTKVIGTAAWGRVLGSFFKYTRYRMFLLIGLIGLSGLTEGLGILMFIPLLSTLADNAPEGVAASLVQVLGWLGINPTLQALLVIIVSVFLLKAFISFLQGSYSIGLVNNMARDLRRDVGGVYYKTKYELIAESKIGTLNNLLTQEVESFCGAFTKFIDLTVVIIYVSIYMTSSYLLSPNMTMSAVILGIVSILGLQSLTKMVRGLSYQVTQNNARVNSSSLEFLQNLEYYKITGFGKIGLDRLNAAVKNLVMKRIQMGRLNLGMSLSVEPSAVFLLCGLIFYHIQIRGGVIEDIMILLILFYRSFTKLMSFQVEWQRFNACVGGLFAVNEFLEVAGQSDKQDLSGDKQPNKFDISLENVTLVRHGHVILKHINLYIEKNEMIGIVGPSGSGKSSLIKVLLGLYQPTEGELTIGGVQNSDIDWRKLRPYFGYLGQIPPIFDASVRDNLTLWQRICSNSDEMTDKRLWDVLSLADCAEPVRRIGGLDVVLGAGGVSLSGGQAQRLALARELIKRPRLLVLDEPTSALDSSAEKTFVKTLGKAKRLATVIIVSHKKETLSACDRIAELNDGMLKINSLSQESG